MNGKENIIQRILSDADEKCRYILSEADEQIQNINKKAQSELSSDKEQLENRLVALDGERQRNTLAWAKLEVRKYILQQKQNLISSCYQKALNSLLSLDDAGTLALLGKLITKYAENNEHVRITPKDKNIVTQKFLDSFNLNLVLDDQIAQGNGGLVLLGEGYEKDLTLEKVVVYLRENTEAQVSATLFGDKND